MTVDPRAALDRLIAALDAHLDAVAARRGEDDPAVDQAYDVLADAFEVYDEALAVTYAEATPFYLGEDDEDDDYDDEDEDERDDDESDRADESDDDLDGLSDQDLETLVDPEKG